MHNQTSCRNPGAAKLAIHINLYQMLNEHLGEKKGSDLVFLSTTGEKLIHITLVLEVAEVIWKICYNSQP